MRLGLGLGLVVGVRLGDEVRHGGLSSAWWVGLGLGLGSKPAQTISIPLKSAAARWSETWMIRRFLRTAAGSASSGAAGVCIGGTPASCSSRSLS